ncbi:membrane spanning protein [Thermincola ferriacetica]|uniref:Membrane spanning protein n=1 Tax=Thermincola ferriacetica TaxID=281456 RepID=A0A0L6W3B3_9FIRM|nr:ABC transporter permease [Thermincola ferriacetica]KNZ69936.1 membrane spanning protein [Thermincola ferriacetica]
MNRIIVNSVNETQKIFQRKKTVVFLIITVLVPAGTAALFVFGQNALGIFAVNSASFPISMLGLFSSLLLPLFIFSMAADLFSGELGDKTLKLTLTRPVTRFKVFLSKNIAIAFFVVVSLALLFVVSVIAGFFLNGGALSLTDLFQTLLAYIMAVVPMLVLGIIGVFLAQFFRNSGAALITSVFVYLAGKATPFLFPTLAKVSPFSYTDWYMMWTGSAVSAGRLINTFLIMLSHSLILFALGFSLFDKKDI